MRCVLVGNFGVGNFGDEALKDYFLEVFPDVDWIVVGRDVPRLPAGIRSLLSLHWIKTLSAYYQADAVVYGGGSLFTDAESVLACVLWWIHSVPAHVFRKPIHLAFQGIGPFRTRVGKWCTRSVLKAATTISVRDEASKNRAENLVKNKKVVQSCDPVFYLIENEKLDVRTENILTLIPRKNSSAKFMNMAQKYAKSRQWSDIRVVSMEPDNAMEMRYVKSLADNLGPVATVHNVKTLHELLSQIAPASQVVSERYHGALPAVFYGKPVEIVSQQPGDKLDELSRLGISGVRHLEAGRLLLASVIH